MDLQVLNKYVITYASFLFIFILGVTNLQTYTISFQVVQKRRDIS